MFYRPEQGHGLPHNPFNAIITPRPIGWISSRSAEGLENLAPYSFFNAVAYSPPQVMFASTSRKSDRSFGKDSMDNIRETGVFCVNIVEYAMREAMNITSGPYGKDIDEFELAGVSRSECRVIPCSRVSFAPANLECNLIRFIELPGKDNHLAIGEVVGIHLRNDCLADGRFDITRFHPIAPPRLSRLQLHFRYVQHG